MGVETEPRPERAYIRNENGDKENVFLGVALCIALIKGDNIVDNLIAICKNIQDKNYKSIAINYNNFLNKFADVVEEQITTLTTVTFDQLRKFQLKLDEANKLIESVDSPDSYTFPMDKDIIILVNLLAQDIRTVQYGMNIIMSSASMIYKVDKSYYQSIKDLETLGKFVKKALQTSMPSKYLAHNVYLLSCNDIKGDGSKGDENNPLWGQTRLVLYPLDKADRVHKIALSGLGIRANKSEINITKAFQKVGKGHLLAQIINSIEDGIIISAQRANLAKEGSLDLPDMRLSNLIKEVDRVCSDNKIPLDLKKDISTYGNVGFDAKGNLILIDYGLLARALVSWNS